MKLMKLNPYRGLTSDIDRFFNDFSLGLWDSDTVWYPTADLTETDDAYEVHAELPGMKKDDIKISFHNNILSINGEKKQEKKTDKKNYHRVERVYGKFERCFRLPDDVKSDEIKAKYKNGVLVVTIPKSEKAKPIEIDVS